MMAVKESSASKIKFKGVDALFGLSEEQECVREIPLDELHSRTIRLKYSGMTKWRK